MFTYVTFSPRGAALRPQHRCPRLAVCRLSGRCRGDAVSPGRWIDVYGHRTGIALAMGIGVAGALLTLVPWLPAIVTGARASAPPACSPRQATTSSYIGAVTPSDIARASRSGCIRPATTQAEAPVGRCRRSSGPPAAGPTASCWSWRCSSLVPRLRSRNGRMRPAPPRDRAPGTEGVSPAGKGP